MSSQTEDRLLAGRYALRERIDRGGSGVAWRARDQLLHRDVTIRSVDDAHAAARLNHPGLVAVFDVVDDDGHPLVVTELVDAPTLLEVVARDGALTDERAAAIGLQVMDALAAARERGVVNLDVSPGNVLLHASGRAQLNDLTPASGPAADLAGLGSTLLFAVGSRPSRLDPIVRDLLGPSPSGKDLRRRLSALHEELSVVEATGQLPAVDDTGQVPSAAPPPPPAPPPPTSPRPRAAPVRRARSPLAPAVPVVLVLVIALAAVLTIRLRERPASPAGGSPATTSPTATSIPDGWTPYHDPSTGFTIAYPSTWDVSTSGTLTDFRDPQTGTYLRVDHRQPPAASPEGAWYDLEPKFAADNDNYHRIRIGSTTYRNYPAAIWEFTYTDGVDLHAADLGFVTGNYGFALYFQTHANKWDAMQPTFDQFKKAFAAPK